MSLACNLGGSSLLAYTRRWDSFGQETSLAASNGAGELSNQAFGYDSVSRLTAVADTVDPAQSSLNGQAAGCQRRACGFDANSNRTSVTSLSWQSTCPGSGCGTVSHSFDSADRLQPSGSDAGMAYDTWERITTLPAGDASSTGTGAGQTTGNVTSTYWSNDLVKTETQGARTLTFGLDANYRVAAIGDTPTVGAMRTNHYSDDGDSASWVDSGNGALSRNVIGLDGNLVATIGETGVVTNQFATPHGDIAATQTAGQPGLAGYAEFDEYGNPRVNNTAGPGGAPSRYGWLGTKRRQSDDLANITLMGVRLYAPQLGRFLQTDPVPGGSANTYDYVNQNPITGYDLDGRFRCGWCHRAAHAVFHTARVKTGGWIKRNRWKIASAAESGVCIAMSAGYCGAAMFAVMAFRVHSIRHRRHHSWTDFAYAAGSSLAFGAPGFAASAGRLGLVWRGFFGSLSIACSLFRRCASPGIPRH